MKAKLFIISCLIFFGLGFKVRGQVSFNKWISGPIGSSPKLSGLGIGSAKVDEVQRSTGTVNINIPLYEIKAHDISVPISISYSALGLKMGQEAGPVGMGWELNAGGKLNRQINGLDDETTTSSIKSSTWFQLNPNTNPSDRTTFMNIAQGETDYAYDIYSYSVPGASGKVARNGLTFPYDPGTKFDYYSSKITTENGLVHAFELGDILLVNRKKSYKRKTDGTYNMEEIPPGLQWVQDIKEQKTDHNLSSITSPRTKEVVEFQYETIESAGPMSGIIGRTKLTTTEQLGLTRKLIRMSSGGWSDLHGEYYFLSEPIVNQTKIDIVKHRRIKNILFATGKVEFIYRDTALLGRDVMTHIKIYQKSNGGYKQLKQYRFNYDADERFGHYLKDVIVLNADSVNAGVWKFNYNGSAGNGQVGKRLVIPNIQSNAQDRWGFFNGKLTNNTLLEKPSEIMGLNDRPTYRSCLDLPGSASAFFRASRTESIKYYSTGNIPVEVNFADRSTQFSSMVAGTISKLTTPTGETITYEYEPHKFYVPGANAVFSKTHEGGGIRVKSITRRDPMLYGLKELSNRTFTYGIGTYNSQSATENGNGLVNIPGMVTSIKQYYEHNGSGEFYENLMTYSHPVNDLTLYAGSYAHYPSVVESTYKGLYVNHQTVYYFSSSPPMSKWTNMPIGTKYDQGFPDKDFNFGIKYHTIEGQPTYVVEYNGTRSGNTIVSVTNNQFTRYAAPAIASKLLYSFYGGVNSTKISTSSTFMMICVADSPDGMQYNCTQIGTVANMDPLGYHTFGPEPPQGWYEGKYHGAVVEYSEYSDVYKLTKTTNTTYNTIYVDPFLTVDETLYDNVLHMQPTQFIKTASEGSAKIKRVKYAYDFLSNQIPGVDLLRGKNIMNEPVEELEMFNPSAPYIMHGRKKTFKTINGLILNDSTYYLNTQGKTVALTNYSPNSTLFEPQQSIDNYDEMGNPVFGSRTKDSKTAVIWGYNQQYPVAEIMNAGNLNEVAYTDFQSDNRPEWKGNWSYTGVPVLDQSSPSKDLVYTLSSGNITKTLPAGKKFVLAYWYKNGSVVTVTGGTVGAEVIKNRSGSWLFAERTVTSGTSVAISGTGYIDELRLCPYESMMKTFTYSPGIGVTKSQDEKGNFAFYEYDKEQRLKIARDQRGNVLKAYEYNIGSDFKQTLIN
ncbi:MAG TPA: hypothetical protein VKB19_15210 [Pedobacter sp.]|nr:hypothetical protein [Pedobacter sp.]